MTRRLFNRLGGRDYRWGVAYQFAENWRSSVLWRSNFIANPPYRFLADPFVFRRENLDVCFVEDYDFRTKKGKISVFKIISGNNYEELGSALDEPFHLSYPSIFTVGNDLYMCPETSEIREIRLYKCIEFPLRWSFHKTLIKDISAADTNVFFFKDRWWLLTNIDSSEVGDHNSELHIFCSDAFDSDAWVPHAKNPVIFDSERARNGGFFQDGDKLFRVFQRHGHDLYGESMGIAQIQDLGMETYGEEVVSRIDPCFAPKIIGTHSFSYCNGLLSVDFLKVEQVKGSRFRLFRRRQQPQYELLDVSRSGLVPVDSDYAQPTPPPQEVVSVAAGVLDAERRRARSSPRYRQIGATATPALSTTSHGTDSSTATAGPPARQYSPGQA